MVEFLRQSPADLIAPISTVSKLNLSLECFFVLFFCLLAAALNTLKVVWTETELKACRNSSQNSKNHLDLETKVNIESLEIHVTQMRIFHNAEWTWYLIQDT